MRGSKAPRRNLPTGQAAIIRFKHTEVEWYSKNCSPKETTCTIFRTSSKQKQWQIHLSVFSPFIHWPTKEKNLANWNRQLLSYLKVGITLASLAHTRPIHRRTYTNYSNVAGISEVSTQLKHIHQLNMKTTKVLFSSSPESKRRTFSHCFDLFLQGFTSATVETFKNFLVKRKKGKKKKKIDTTKIIFLH